MKRLLKSLMLGVLAFHLYGGIGHAEIAQSSSYKSFAAFTGGFSSASACSSSFANVAAIGQTCVGNAESASYRHYAGILPAFITVVDVVISFVDESPTSGDWQDTTHITAKITVETSGGNGVGMIKYRVSNAGPEEDTFGAWQTDASTDSVITSNKLRFQIAIPNAAGQVFSESENNYIQWRVKNTGNLESISGKYRVKVRGNDIPVVTILQPDEKGGIAAAAPMIEARITDQYWGVDPSKIQIKIDKTDGTNVSTLNSSGNLGIFAAQTGLLSYKYDAAPLAANAAYKLTISATDRNGAVGNASVTFTVKGGAIADLVPYPSPFDPKVQPIMIRYVLSKHSTVSVNIYDMSGRLVRSVTDNQSRDPGISEDAWYGNNFADKELANGVYVCEVITKDEDGEHRKYTSLAIFGK